MHRGHADEPQPGGGSAVRELGPAGNIPRAGIGGHVGSGKTALIEALVPIFMRAGHVPIVITNDIVTQEDAQHVRRTLDGLLDGERVAGVETGTCPHAAVREDPTMNIAVAAEMEARFPDSAVLLLESGGDNLTLTFSPELVDYWVYVIDVAAGEKIPRKNGPGITDSDLLVINKTDLAPHVGASLEVMRHDADAKRPSKPTLFTNCKTGEGVDAVAELLATELLHTSLSH